MDAARILQTVLRSDFRMVRINTAATGELVAQFKGLSLKTGRAVYHWRPGVGLYRLGGEYMLIPRTRTPSEVLSYIRARRHFGVYLLEYFAVAMEHSSVIDRLLQLDQAADGIDRILLLPGTEITIPERLAGRVATLQPRNGAAGDRAATGATR